MICKILVLAGLASFCLGQEVAVEKNDPWDQHKTFIEKALAKNRVFLGERTTVGEYSGFSATLITEYLIQAADFEKLDLKPLRDWRFQETDLSAEMMMKGGPGRLDDHLDAHMKAKKLKFVISRQGLFVIPESLRLDGAKYLAIRPNVWMEK